MGAEQQSSSREGQAETPVMETVERMVGVKDDAKKQKQWNTHNLSSRLGVDAMCAATAGGLVAPLITIVDKCIIENASGKRTMGASIRASLTQLLTRPHRFLTSKPFLLIYLLYGGTYVTANTLDTFKSTIDNKPATATTRGLAKFSATSAANLSLCLYKDSQFTQLFGTVSARPIPPVTYALFMLRDSLTVFASFNLPPIVAPRVPISDAVAEKYFSRATAAQFLIPASMQLISTPLHLMGLDLYNREEKASIGERLAKVRADYLKSMIARIARIVPAFGVGGVVNNEMRKRLMAQL